MLRPPLTSPQPTLTTGRLVMRPLTLADSPEVQRLAGEREVASTTRLIPHPYPEGLAESWIGSLADKYRAGELVTFAICATDGQLMGSIRLSLNLIDQHAEMGYWIGTAFWNNGYCTEAAAGVLQYGFEGLGLSRIYANYMARNPASGRVLAKLGMSQEGVLRRHRFKWDQFEDLVVCGILREEYFALQKVRARKRTPKNGDGKSAAKS